MFLALAIVLQSFNCCCANSKELHGLIGFTYTQDNIFIAHSQGSDAANIQIYGWGTVWPFPEGGAGEHDNGETVEKRIKQAVNDGQKVVLTCATAPSNYRLSNKPWNMEERVKTDMEDQYATRCAEAVKRWPDVSRVQVWNELKGYWNPQANRWDYKGYTRFYDKVYQAVRAARPDILIGGGYVILRRQGRGFDKLYNGVLLDSRGVDALQYWITHAAGYDAVCVDGGLAPDDYLKVTSFVRKLANDKPIWWSEYYGKHEHDVHDMRVTRELFSRNLHSDDMALWWAGSSYPW
jgi:hypothetical protein